MSENGAGTKSALNQVRGEEERGLLQHRTPTSSAGRGASGGCDQGLGCWKFRGTEARGDGEAVSKNLGKWQDGRLLQICTSPRRLVRAASSPAKVPRWPQAAAKCNAHTLMGPPWASSSTAFTHGLKNLAESCWRHFDDARKV